MNESEATVVIAGLAAAWPRDWAFVDPLTKDIYLKRIVAMPRVQAAEAAVNSLIDTAVRLPTVAELREEYRRHHDRFSPPALEEPDLDDDAKARNVRRMRTMTDHLSRSAGHVGSFDECPHPDCEELRSLSVPGAGQD